MGSHRLPAQRPSMATLLSVTFYFWYGAGKPGGVSCYAPIPDKGCNVSKFIMRHALKDFASEVHHS